MGENTKVSLMLQIKRGARAIAVRHIPNMPGNKMKSVHSQVIRCINALFILAANLSVWPMVKAVLNYSIVIN